MQRLIRSRRQHENLVPLVRQQFGVYLDGYLQVEGQLLRPRHQLVHDRIADVAQLVANLRFVLEKLGEVRQRGNVLHRIEIDERLDHVA